MFAVARKQEMEEASVDDMFTTSHHRHPKTSREMGG